MPTEAEKKAAEEKAAADAAAKAEAEKNRVPFHEDPKIQEYLGRQIEKRVAEILQEKENQAQHSKSNGDNEFADIVELLTNEFQLEPSAAKKYAKIIETVADRVSERKLVDVQSNMKSVTLQHKITNFAASHPDMFGLKDEMLETLNKLPKDEQEFIRSSENGIDWLYSKVKLRVLSLSGGDRQQAASHTGGGSSKTEGGDSTILQKAQEAFSKGHVQEYNRLMQEHKASQK